MVADRLLQRPARVLGHVGDGVPGHGQLVQHPGGDAHRLGAVHVREVRHQRPAELVLLAARLPAEQGSRKRRSHGPTPGTYRWRGAVTVASAARPGRELPATATYGGARNGWTGTLRGPGAHRPRRARRTAAGWHPPGAALGPRRPPRGGPARHHRLRGELAGGRRGAARPTGPCSRWTCAAAGTARTCPARTASASTSTDLLAAVAHLRLDRPVLAGHSLGAYLALLAADRRTRTRSAGCCWSTAGLPLPVPGPGWTWMRCWTRAWARRWPGCVRPSPAWRRTSTSGGPTRP